MIKRRFLCVVAALFLLPSARVDAQRYASDAKIDGFAGAVKSSYQVIYEAEVAAGSMTHGEVLERLQTEYNSKGLRRNMTYYTVSEGVIFRTRYKHDGFGLTTLEHIVDPEENIIGRTYYVYDAHNTLTETYVEDAERQVESRILIRYDSFGRVSQRSYNDQFNEIYKREVYTYGPDGNVQKTVVYDRDENKVQEWRYEYDVHNQPVSQTLYDYTEQEPEVFFTLFKYTYDNRGNWIQKVEYELEGADMTPVYITERKISYFD